MYRIMYKVKESSQWNILSFSIDFAFFSSFFNEVLAVLTSRVVVVIISKK